jgi:glucuronate isomerase
MEDYENTLHELAQEAGPLYAPTGRLRKAKSVTRADVIAAFNHSFEMIGGVPRLAVWADQNPTDFFKLYGRLLPSSSTTELDGPQEILVKMAFNPRALTSSQQEVVLPLKEAPYVEDH